MKLTVFGASGRTGVLLVRQALADGHEVVAFVRSPESFPISDDALTVVEGDAYTGENVQTAVAGADAVISVLGQSDDGPDDLLTVAGEHITEAMATEGVSRFLTLVGAGVRKAGESVPLSGKVMGVLLKVLAGNVLADARDHVEQVSETDLNWTVVRAPRLTDDDGTGEYRAGDIDLGFAAVSRADVARMILDCVENDEYIRELPKVGPA